MNRPARWALALVWPLVLASAACGDANPSASGPAMGPSSDAPRESHAWASLPTSDGRWELIHVPPEVVANDPARSPNAGAGWVHVARVLQRQPQAIAAWDRRVYLAFPARRLDADTIARDIRAFDVTPSPIRGLWQYGDAERLDALPSLPGRGRLVGFVGTDLGPAALLDENGIEIWLLLDREWVRLPTPAGAALSGVGVACGLVVVPSGVGLWSADDDDANLWITRVDPKRPDAEPQWTRTPLARGEGPAPAGAVAYNAGELVSWYRSTDTVYLRAAGPDGVRSLTRLDGVPDAFSIAAKSGVGSVALVWSAVRPDAAGHDRRWLEVREVSLASGRLRYAGPALSQALSKGQHRLIVFAVLGVTLIIVVSAARQGDAGAALLPAGCALAPPHRRLLATAIDFCPALMLGIRVAGAQPEDFAPFALAGPGQNAILLGLGLAWLHTTIGESLWHRSLGKALAGIAVVGVRPVTAPDGTISVPLRKPTLIESGIRNLVKWWLPPVSLFGTLSNSRRHRGDIITRLAIVAPADTK